MVDIACGAAPPAVNGHQTNANGTGDEASRQDDEDQSGSSQYFLITPKLLHDLSYSRGMQVMCIASGEYMPEDRTRVDFRACVDRMKGLKAERLGLLGLGLDRSGEGGRLGSAAG